MAESNDGLRFAGDVKIDEVSIITNRGFANQITPQVIGLEIYEDLFAPFITGKVFIKDSQDLQNLFPLIGEEVIKFSVRTPGLPDSDNYINREFAIFKMDDRLPNKERETIYVLHFISKEAFVDLNKKLSAGFQGEIHEIIKKLLQEPLNLETKKPVDIEPTMNKTRFIANWWSPVRAIKFACDQAVDMQGHPAFTFWEDKHGFHFKSLISLYTGTPMKQRFKWSNETGEITNSGQVRKDLDKDYATVLELEFNEGFDYMMRLKSGMYGSEIVYFDIMTQQYVHKGFRPEWTGKDSLNPYPLYTDKVVSKTRAKMFMETQYFNAFEDYEDVSKTKIIQAREQILAKAEAYKVQIQVFGRFDYNVGDRVFLEVPKRAQLREDMTQDEKLDQLMSGYYLIGALCHYVDREAHKTTIELIKDSYITGLPTNA